MQIVNLAPATRTQIKPTLAEPMERVPYAVPALPVYAKMATEACDATLRPAMNSIVKRTHHVLRWMASLFANVGPDFAELMERLDYDRYGVQGGDWGGIIGRSLAGNYPDRVIGFHTNFVLIR